MIDALLLVSSRLLFGPRHRPPPSLLLMTTTPTRGGEKACGVGGMVERKTAVAAERMGKKDFTMMDKREMMVSVRVGTGRGRRKEEGRLKTD